MANGTMFAGLLGYYEQSFYEEHRYVYIITEAETLTCEVFSAYITDEVSEAYSRTFESPEAFERFVAGAVRKSWLASDARPSENDRVITLSTCTKPGVKERFVVHARLAV